MMDDEANVNWDDLLMEMMADEDEANDSDGDTALIVSSQKGSLSGMMRFEVHYNSDGGAPSVSKQDIRDAINYYVLWSSKAAYRGGLVLYAQVLQSYDGGHRQFKETVLNDGGASTFLEQCFNPNQGNLQNRLVSSNVLNQMNLCFPINLLYEQGTTRFPSGYTRFVHYVAKTYATNCSNHWKMNFFVYQRRTIIAYLQSHGFKRPKSEVPHIIEELMRRINNWPNNGQEEAQDEEEEEEANDHFDLIFNEYQTETQSFVDQHRNFFLKRLGHGFLINEEWVDNPENLHYIPLYFVRMLRIQETLQNHPDLKVKLLQVVPLHSMSIRHIDLDQVCLYYILKRAGFQNNMVYSHHLDPQDHERLTFPSIRGPVGDNFRPWWGFIFDITRGLTGSRHTFHYPLGIRTNGIQASLSYRRTILVLHEDWHYNAELPPPPLGEIDDHAAAAAPDAPPSPPPVDVEMDLGDDHAPADAPPSPPPVDVEMDLGDDHAPADAPPSPPPVDVDWQLARILAFIDPGSIRFFYSLYARIPDHQINHSIDETFFQVPGLPGSIEFSCGQYIHESCPQILDEYLKRIRAPLKSDEIRFSKTSLKVSNKRRFYKAIRNRTNDETWNRWWRIGSCHQWRRHKFHVEGRRKSSLERAVSRIGDALPQNYQLEHVGLGDGTFSPTVGRRRRAVPTVEVKVQIGRIYSTQHYDEFRTSSICPRCECQLYNVHHDLNSRRRYSVHPLKRCLSFSCRDHSWWHRDFVGAAGGGKRFLVDCGVLHPDCLPDLQDRQADTTNWRRNNGPENSICLTSPVGSKLTKKQKKQLTKEKKKAKRERYRLNKKKAREAAAQD